MVKPGLINTAMLPTGRLSQWLAVDKEQAATKILSAIFRKKKQLIFPFKMRLLTTIIANLPKSLQAAVLNKTKQAG